MSPPRKPQAAIVPVLETTFRFRPLTNSGIFRHALEGDPFQIHFFYGQPDSQLAPSDYSSAPNLIGTYRTFTSPMSSHNQKRRRASSNHLSTGQISLSPLLANAISNGVLPDTSLAPESVVPKLSKNRFFGPE